MAIAIAHGQDDETRGVTYPARAVHSGKRVGVQALAHGELVRHLEQGVHAEDLGQVGLEAGEHVVVEQDIARDLLVQVLGRAGVGQAELCSPLGKGGVEV